MPQNFDYHSPKINRVRYLPINFPLIVDTTMKRAKLKLNSSRTQLSSWAKRRLVNLFFLAQRAHSADLGDDFHPFAHWSLFSLSFFFSVSVDASFTSFSDRSQQLASARCDFKYFFFENNERQDELEIAQDEPDEIIIESCWSSTCDPQVHTWKTRKFNSVLSLWFSFGSSA